MIKRHPSNRAERMMINEKKKRDKRKGVEGLSHKSSGTLPSDVDGEREDN